jgi:NAD(P)-dependent dehydrogenase (short-subunit alcohol dehydrogenase family)
MTASHTALITGASRGLGLALARALAEQGWTLLIDARGAEELEAARAELAQKTHVMAIAGDVSDASHRQALAEAAQSLGSLDALVNNASILGPSPQPNLLDYPLDVLRDVYEVNTVAPLALLQATRHLLNPGARILNITSDAAVEPYEGWGGYGSSKAALEQLSHIIAAERPAWRVYWVDPGDMRTQMHQEAFPSEDISDRPLPETSVPGLLALLTGDLPSGRYQARALPSAEQPEASAPPPDTAPGAAPTGLLRELRVALRVDDFARVAEFYRDGLGLATIKAWDDPEGRGLILAAGQATLEILDHADSDHTDQVEAGRIVSGPVRLALRVEDVAATARALRDHGATVAGEPVVTSWGSPSQRLQAPDGMQLTLFQPPDQATAKPEGH